MTRVEISSREPFLTVPLFSAIPDSGTLSAYLAPAFFRHFPNRTLDPILRFCRNPRVWIGTDPVMYGMSDDVVDVSIDDLAAGDDQAWGLAYDSLYHNIWKVLKARLLPGFGVDWDNMACEIITKEIIPGLRDRETASFQKLKTFSDLLTMSRTIAARRSVDVIRRVTRRGEESLPEGWEQSFGGIVNDGDGSAEGMESFMLIVSGLKPPKPELFFDYFVGDLTYTEIAEKRGIPIGTVCSHFNRGLKALRASLETAESGEVAS